MTEPTRPYAWSRVPAGIVGMKVPKRTSPMSGFETKKLTMKQIGRAHV